MAGAPTLLKVTKSPSEECALTNFAYLHPADAAALSEEILRRGAMKAALSTLPASNYLQVGGLVLSFLPNDAVAQGRLALSADQRVQCRFALDDRVACLPYLSEDAAFYAYRAVLRVGYRAKQRDGSVYPAAALEAFLGQALAKQFLAVGQWATLPYEGTRLKVEVLSLETVDAAGLLQTSEGVVPPVVKGEATLGLITPATHFELRGVPPLRLAGGRHAATLDLARPDLNPEAMGIGGLDREFGDIFRRAFVTRLFPPEILAKLGVKHVKGILLHGPPGTGKTLTARQIGRLINAREPKIVAGPEILNKYVGQSEENVRGLFKDAEDDYKARGENADLHVIIFDEIDAICRARGQNLGGTGVGDTVVNQLLAKIDGVSECPNVLVIGMTNRLDLIDEALLRPGRLEVKMEFGLPDEAGREQILRIHTARMAANGYLSPAVDLAELARQAKNFSGAELEGLVKAATSFALNEHVDPAALKCPRDLGSVAVEPHHFAAALTEVRPAFGVAEDELSHCAPNGLVDFGAGFRAALEAGKRGIRQVRAEGTRTPLVSLLLTGGPGCGKTAVAAHLALTGGFAYAKLLAAEALVGLPDPAKCARIAKVFGDAYRSPLSVVVLDDIERLLEYAPVGPRFSNAVLQHLLVFAKKLPPPGRRLFVVGTSSTPGVLRDLAFYDSWDAVAPLPPVQGPAELAAALRGLGLPRAEGGDRQEAEKALAALCADLGGAVPVKRLIYACEAARQAGGHPETLGSCLRQESEAV